MVPNSHEGLKNLASHLGHKLATGRPLVRQDAVILRVGLADHVEQHLIACQHLVPVQGVEVWQGCQTV